LAAFIDLNRVLKYATRFTDEVFAFLIISIFLLDAIGDPYSGNGMLQYFNKDSKYNQAQLELDPTYSYLEVALLSLLLGLGTAFFALGLRAFRTSPFFCNDSVRTSVCDFSITLSVIAFTLIANLAFSDVPLEQLNVPDAFEPTFTCCTSDCVTNGQLIVLNKKNLGASVRGLRTCSILEARVTYPFLLPDLLVLPLCLSGWTTASLGTL
jgi:hypothetical protein